MTISERILTLLKTSGNTQKALSDMLNVTPSTVNTWIKGNADNIPSSYIMPICRFFGVCPEELLEGTVAEHETLSSDESKLLSLYRNMTDDSRIIVLAAAVTESRRGGSEA